MFILLLQNHGLITLGKTFSEALDLPEKIDEAARIFIFTQGKARPISGNDLEAFRIYFDKVEASAIKCKEKL